MTAEIDATITKHPGTQLLAKILAAWDADGHNDAPLLEDYDDAAQQLYHDEARFIMRVAGENGYLFTAAQRGAAAEGWRLVPVEPTEAMIEAGNAEYERALIGNRRDITAAFLRRWSAMLAAAPAAAPASSPAAEGAIKAAQITMGRGLVDVTSIKHEGRAGILFRPRETFRPVGTDGELHEGSYWPSKSDVVIWIENPEGAAVIRDYLDPFLPAASSPAAGDKTRLMLAIMDAAGGFAAASGDPGEWIAYFCDDGEPDTFNAASDAGLISVSHDVDSSTGTARLTDAGRAYLAVPHTPAAGDLRELLREFRDYVSNNADHLSHHDQDGIWTRVAEAIENGRVLTPEQLRAALSGSAPSPSPSPDTSARIAELEVENARLKAEVNFTGCYDKDKNPLYVGDRVLYRNEGRHTKPEYWNPEYEIIRIPGGFTLNRVGGGLSGNSLDFRLRHGGGNGNLELIARAALRSPTDEGEAS